MHCYLSTKTYLEVIDDVRYLGAQLTNFPMETNLKLTNHQGDLLHDPTRYEKLVGRPIYLTITRPDITYAVNILSQFMHAPRKPHWDAAFRTIKYLKGSPGLGLFFSSSNSFTLKAYCDANWANCPMTRRSTTCYYVFLIGVSRNRTGSKYGVFLGFHKCNSLV